jgi:hypothetical protein
VFATSAEKFAEAVDFGDRAPDVVRALPTRSMPASGSGFGVIRAVLDPQRCPPDGRWWAGRLADDSPVLRPYHG